MREILFRGIDKSTCKWVYGDLLQRDEGRKIKAIMPPYPAKKGIVVKEDSIGQYTGLKDKNGRKIFEGDIVKAQDDITLSPFCDGITGVVVYDETSFFLEPERVEESQYLFNECADYEVLGNIYDNPELLKGVRKNEQANKGGKK